MNRTILALALSAVALPSFAAEPRPRPYSPAFAPPASFSSCYIGAAAGFGWLKSSANSATEYNFVVNDASPSTAGNAGTTTSGGALLSGAFGCDHYFGTWLVGGRIGGDWSFISGSGKHRGADAWGDEVLGYEQKWAITAAARLGYGLSKTAMVYVLGGASQSHFEYTDAGENTPYSSYYFYGGSDRTKYGWLVGFGIEQRLSQSFTLSLEYNYTDFGKKNTLYRYTGDATDAWMYRLTEATHALKIGTNYRFGSW